MYIIDGNKAFFAFLFLIFTRLISKYYNNYATRWPKTLATVSGQKYQPSECLASWRGLVNTLKQSLSQLVPLVSFLRSKHILNRAEPKKQRCHINFFAMLFEC